MWARGTDMRHRIYSFIALALLIVSVPIGAQVLTGTPAISDANLGKSTAVGNNLIFGGSPGLEGVRVWRRDGSSFTELDMLQAPVYETGALFGRDIDVSSDDKVLAVCATLDDERGQNAGLLYVYEGNGDGTYPTRTMLYGTDTSAAQRFCEFVDMNDDGTVIVVGVPNVSSVYVFYRSAVGQPWNQKKLTGLPGGSSAGYGVAVDGVAGNDTLIAVGAPLALHFDSATQSWYFGSVFVFQKNYGGTNNWGLRMEMYSPLAERLGYSVGISQALGIISGSAPLDGTSGGSPGIIETTGQGRGAVYIFRITGTSSYVLEKKLISTALQDDAEYGWALALDDTKLIVCEPFSDVAGVHNAGRAHVYNRVGTNWIHQTAYLPPDPDSTDESCSSAALRNGRAIVGGPFSDASGLVDAGAVYVVLAGANGLTNIFNDGFETGNTSLWSSTLP